MRDHCVEEPLSKRVATYPIDNVYKHLEKYHGISKHLASDRLHRIKTDNGLPPDFDLLIDRTGNAYRSDDRTYVGSLTSGGKKED
jgi:hypothetical protein